MNPVTYSIGRGFPGPLEGVLFLDLYLPTGPFSGFAIPFTGFSGAFGLLGSKSGPTVIIRLIL